MYASPTRPRLIVLSALCAAAVFAALVMLLRGAQVTGAIVSFPDVPPNHPYTAAIRWAKEQGIIQGYPDGTFRPDSRINRAEFLQVLLFSRYPAERVRAAAPARFPDVRPSDWYSPLVGFATERGIVKGYPDGTFRAASAITVAESLKIVVTEYNLQTRTMVARDAPWYMTYAVAANDEGILPPTLREAGQLLTRGELAEMLYRLSGRNSAVVQIPTEDPLHGAAPSSAFAVSSAPASSAPRSAQSSSGPSVEELRRQIEELRRKTSSRSSVQASSRPSSSRAAVSSIRSSVRSSVASSARSAALSSSRPSSAPRSSSRAPSSASRASAVSRPDCIPCSFPEKWIRVSGDGKVFAYRTRKGVAVFRKDTGEQRLLTFRRQDGSQYGATGIPEMSLDGGTLAFTAAPDLGQGARVVALYSWQTNGYAVVEEGIDPSLSADGRFVLYVTARGFVIYDAKNKAKAPVLAGGAGTPALSPDAAAFAYRDPATRALLLRMAGGQESRTIDASAADGTVRVGAGGRFIASMHALSGGSRSVQIYDAQSGSAEPVTPPGGAVATLLDMTPDGSVLLLSLTRSQVPGVTVGVFERSAQRFTPLYKTTGDARPSFSADGRLAAVLDDGAGTAQVFSAAGTPVDEVVLPAE